MATGITGREQLSADAITAAAPERDLHPLPSAAAEVSLAYPARLSIEECLAPVPAIFSTVTQGGSATKSAIVDNSLVLSDNLLALHALRQAGRKVTLFYLDPPYNTGMDFQSRQLEHSYKDSRGTAAYCEFMRRRLYLMRELLTDDGSVYVHIGHQMLGHMKVIMDEVFGAGNFRNIITRRKCSSKNFTKHQYLNLNDYVLFYTKSDNYKWNQPGAIPDADWIAREYPKVDSRGRYKLVPVHAPGTRSGETGGLWRGVPPPPGKHWQYVPSKLDAMDKAGEIHWSKNKNPRRKVYLTDAKIIPYTDYWADFRDAHHQSIAVTGYPTEKNLAMLKMIVGASTEPGDLVVDPFCGSGTTLQAAQELGRLWIGIDESFAAVKASLTRIRHGVEAMGDFVERMKQVGQTEDVVVDLFGARPRGDRKESATSKGRHAFHGADAAFMVEAHILETYVSEVRALSST
jgi:adenine-specific DNA-methyltransferase